MIQLTDNNLVSAASPIGEGDAGLIIRADGTPQIFNTYTAAQLEAPTPEQLEHHAKLVALTVAWSLPEIMATLLQIANDPRVVKPGIQHQKH